MAKININLELSLQELKAIYWLLSNMKFILNIARNDKNMVNYPFYSFFGSQERNISILHDFYEKIEPIVEK